MKASSPARRQQKNSESIRAKFEFEDVEERSPSTVLGSRTSNLAYIGFTILFIGILNIFVFHNSVFHHVSSLKNRMLASHIFWNFHLRSTNHGVPVYFINLKTSQLRKRFMEAQLSALGLKYKRIEALKYRDQRAKVMRNIFTSPFMHASNRNEITCIASHLVALYEAVNDSTFFSESPYAIIMEDDFQIEILPNFETLLDSAPADFHVLQMTTSNDELVVKLFNEYVQEAEEGQRHLRSNTSEAEGMDAHFYRSMWHRRAVDSFLWSTQAYAVRKDAVRETINRMVSKGSDGRYHVSLINNPEWVETCKDIPGCDTMYPRRIVADVYLYDILGTTYTIKVPLMNGAKEVGYVSTIQPFGAKEAELKKAFANIGRVVAQLKESSQWVLPSEFRVVGQQQQ